ncbi:unnamed protein product [Cuscuta campestris]|uniref:Uncharacterized protein n=1 Tax=Cuscuta campestris TaxID=132261 RepID=A0A484K4W7_9ASTE|nr:unnamed protein product [Cuscuta campestris]
MRTIPLPPSIDSLPPPLRSIAIAASCITIVVAVCTLSSLHFVVLTPPSSLKIRINLLCHHTDLRLTLSNP